MNLCTASWPCDAKDWHLYDVVKDPLTLRQGAADFQWREVDLDTGPRLWQEMETLSREVFSAV